LEDTGYLVSTPNGSERTAVGAQDHSA
jgi:hypothetical protein